MLRFIINKGLFYLFRKDYLFSVAKDGSEFYMSPTLCGTGDGNCWTAMTRTYFHLGGKLNFQPPLEATAYTV
jgi:hypothetical protein